MTTTTHTCPPIEEIAALLDGRLEEQDRLRVIQHLDECPECYEVFIGAARFLEEESAVPPVVVSPVRKGRVVKFPLGDSTAVRRWLPLAAAAALAVAVSIPVYRTSFAPPQIGSTDALVRSLEGAPGLQENLWSLDTYRGEGDTAVGRASAFLIGVYLVDRQILLSAGAPREAARLSQEIANTLPGLRFGEEEAEPFYQEWQDADEKKGLPPQDLLREMTSAEARERIQQLEETAPFSDYLAFGKWTEAARIAAVTGNAQFLQQRDIRRFPAHFLKQEGEYLEPIRQTLETVEEILDSRALQKTELQNLAKLLGESGSEDARGIIEFFEEEAARDPGLPGYEDVPGEDPVS